VIGACYQLHRISADWGTTRRPAEFPILQILHPYVAESIELFDGLTSEEKSRVIFIHMNHTNPLLIDGSPEQAEVERHGFRFAHEGMRLEL